MALRINRTENFNSDNSLQVLGEASQVCFDQEIRLLVWNMFKARKRNWMHDFSELIRGQHLVILQEAVYGGSHDSFFNTNAEFEWVMARSFRNRRTGIETGVKTGSIAPSTSHASIFSPHSEPLSRTPKLLLSTRYNMNSSAEQLLVLNVHAINFVSLRKYTSQLEQFNTAIVNHTGPIILAGDFNTWSAKRYRQFRRVALESGLQEALMERTGRIHHFNQHLDHVYYRGLALQDIKTLSSISSSDHYPIRVTFTYQCRPTQGLL